MVREKRDSLIHPVTPLVRRLRRNVIHLLIASFVILAVKFFNPKDTGDHLFAAYMSVAIYLLSFDVISKSGFFKSTTAENIRYKNSSLPDDFQNQLLERIRLIMENDKPYLKQDFSLPELAERTGSSVHIVSQVVNAKLNKSFFEMVGEYRVNEAMRLLKEKSNIKVEEIAELVGYSSKSSFNTAFKKITRQTPSQFRNS